MTPCLILDVTDAFEAITGVYGVSGCERIPADRRPTVLQPDREEAEKEALRLAARFPGRRFAVFAAAALAQTIDVPTHVSISGQVLVAGKSASLAKIGPDDEVPF